jgi:hypothetical protein
VFIDIQLDIKPPQLSQVITLAKKSDHHYYDSYMKWDSSFKTPFMHVMVLRGENALRDSR